MAATREKTGYLKTLDGWRAIAILGVISYHDTLLSVGPLNTGWLQLHGQDGVDLFFAISGLLICWRMLEEEQKNGSISLMRFYIRRAFRILPAALLCLSVIGILALTGVISLGLREWLGALLFLRNYMTLLGPEHPDRWFTNHFWSLSVEEHFYFLLPGLLVFTNRRWRVPVLAAITLLVEAHRMQSLWHRPWDAIKLHTDIRLDALLIPAILAILAHEPRNRERFKAWLRWWPALVLVVIAALTWGHNSFWQTMVVAYVMPLMVLGAVLNPENWLGRALEWSPLRYVGRISYSLYLWQQLFFVERFAKGRLPLGVLESTPLRYVATAACALLSYYLLERPMIKLGHRIAGPRRVGAGVLVER